MKQKLIALVALVLTFPLLGSEQRSPSGPATFLVSLAESEMDLSRYGVTVGDCVLVLPDGRFHLERRRQDSPGSRTTLKIFESSLTAPEFQQLREILDRESIKNLPPYAQSGTSMMVTRISRFEARIPRGNGVQKAGYYIWYGRIPQASPDSTPENIKQGWKDSESALQPLVLWFHALEATKLRRHGKSTLCLAPGEVDPSLIR